MTPNSAVSMGVPSCLSEEDVLAFAGGALSPERRELAHRHLDVCELCQELLNEAVRALATAGCASPGASVELAWSTTFQPGALVARRYLIRRFIARGGMGEVYEAFDQELQEQVALKTVTSTACDNPSAARRLKAEVQLARRVSHPNVCRIYDFGSDLTPNGAPVSFLTMQFVDGETLGARIRRSGALPVEEARALGRSLLRGLAAAHDAGVLHRDFKSDNVILLTEAAQSKPLILDFGLARAFDQTREHSSASGRGLVGTLAYIAPEQLEGKPYTTASDIYSFGLVWFEMLTGELPFLPRSSPAVTTLDRLTRPVPPPSSRNPAVPGDLDAVVLACLRRSSSERLQTAGEVLARLDALEQGTSEPQARRKWLSVVFVAALAPSASYVLLAQGDAPHGTLGVAASATAGALIERAPEVAAVSPPRPAAAGAPARAMMPAPSLVPSVSLEPRTAVAATPGSEPRRIDRRNPFTMPKVRAPAASSAPSPAAAHAPAVGWENPFAGRAAKASGELGAVLDQPPDGRATARDAQLAEGGR